MQGKEVAHILESNGVIHFPDPYIVGFGWEDNGSLLYPFKPKPSKGSEEGGESGSGGPEGGPGGESFGLVFLVCVEGGSGGGGGDNSQLFV